MAAATKGLRRNGSGLVADIVRIDAAASKTVTPGVTGIVP
jgi:hypothetical protein